MALCVMLVGGSVLHWHCRQAGALLWKKRSLTIALGLLHGKQIKHLSFLGVEHFILGWSYLLISKAQQSLFLATQSAQGLTLFWKQLIEEIRLIMACLCAALISLFTPLVFPHHACMHNFLLCLFKKQSWLLYINKRCLLYVTKKSVYKVWLDRALSNHLGFYLFHGHQVQMTVRTQLS